MIRISEAPEDLCNRPKREPMDALSEVISFLKPQAAMTGVTEGHATWGLEFSGYDYVKFGFISKGQCWLTVRGQKNVLLEEGDAWMLIRPLVFRLGSEIAGPSELSEDVFKKPKPRYILGKPTAKSLKCVVFGGGLWFDNSISELVLNNL
ncbi:MAG: AraC family transcriptional regulator, partial [Proteobacteria bacterium]